MQIFPAVFARIIPCSMNIFWSSKQNQLWNEGAAFYRGKSNNKTDPHTFGIYSIKQREIAKLTPKGNYFPIFFRLNR